MSFPAEAAPAPTTGSPSRSSSKAPNFIFSFRFTDLAAGCSGGVVVGEALLPPVPRGGGGGGGEGEGDPLLEEYLVLSKEISEGYVGVNFGVIIGVRT